MASAVACPLACFFVVFLFAPPSLPLPPFPLSLVLDYLFSPPSLLLSLLLSHCHTLTYSFTLSPCQSLRLSPSPPLSLSPVLSLSLQLFLDAKHRVNPLSVIPQSKRTRAPLRAMESGYTTLSAPQDGSLTNPTV